MATEIKVPELGESIREVQIAEWQKHQGDAVKKDETLATIESEKATVELPAPVAGILSRILKADGQDAQVGDVIGEIEEGKAGDTKKAARKQDQAPASQTEEEPKPSSKPPQKASAKNQSAQTEERSDAKKKQAPQSKANKAPRIMPAAQALLEEHGLDPKDVAATGPGGRLLKEDVLAYLESSKGESEPAEPSREERAETAKPKPPVPEPTPSAAQPPLRHETQEERVQEVIRMSPLRRTVARRLLEAQRSMAMLTTFNEVDMSAVSALRSEFKDAFQQRHGVKLGFMSFFVKAAIGALQENLRLNAEVRGDDIVLHHYFDIGVAIGAGKGLVVPSIRNAEHLGFAEIEQVIADFAARARENKLKPEELEGGTFTISNGGVYGSLLSTPIINPPQSGILGLHSIQDRPVARNGEVVIRPMMNVALTYDHRIVDGREAVTFLRRVKEIIENPSRLLLEV